MLGEHSPPDIPKKVSPTIDRCKWSDMGHLEVGRVSFHPTYIVIDKAMYKEYKLYKYISISYKSIYN